MDSKISVAMKANSYLTPLQSCFARSIDVQVRDLVGPACEYNDDILALLKQVSMLVSSQDREVRATLASCTAWAEGQLGLRLYLRTLDQWIARLDS